MLFTRLINAGVSAETLKVLMGHSDFSKTERYYGAKRKAQSAAEEIAEKLDSECTKSELVGQSPETAELSESDIKMLKEILSSI